MAIHLTRIYTRTGDDGSTALGDLSRVRKTDPRVAAYADCEETNAALGAALALGGLDEPIAAVLRQLQNDLFDVGADLCVPLGRPPAAPTPGEPITAEPVSAEPIPAAVPAEPAPGEPITAAASAELVPGEPIPAAAPAKPAPGEPIPAESAGERARLRVDSDYARRLEAWCDEFNATLPTLTSFVLPGGSAGAALLHQARVAARRAERSAWALREADAGRGPTAARKLDAESSDTEGVNPAVLVYLNRLSDLLFVLARCANPGGDTLWSPGGPGGPGGPSDPGVSGGPSGPFPR
ncbi:MAG: hypothetical protein FWD74_10890 [Actinomycetia bacterium]|nr:hypothetical protein [Actinomycetes bacterium]